MRTLLVKLLELAVEALLQGIPIHARWLATLRHHRPVHLLVAAIILRTAGPRKLNLDSQPDLPHAQLTQAPRPPATRTVPIIHPDDLRQHLTAKQRLERRLGKVSFCFLQRVDFEDKTAVQIRHR